MLLIYWSWRSVTLCRFLVIASVDFFLEYPSLATSRSLIVGSIGFSFGFWCQLLLSRLYLIKKSRCLIGLAFSWLHGSFWLYFIIIIPVLFKLNVLDIQVFFLVGVWLVIWLIGVDILLLIAQCSQFQFILFFEAAILHFHHWLGSISLFRIQFMTFKKLTDFGEFNF